jgi:protein arginine kinase activator
MKCDGCKEGEATVHLTQIVGGKVQKIDLCEACAKAKGVSDPTDFSLAGVLLGLGQEAAPVPSAAADETRCPACEMTLADFRRAARLGCPRCYEAFAEALAPMLKGMHKSLQHVGKTPPGRGEKALCGELMKQLRQELQAAVKAENFETAARLRDEIKTLDQRMEEKGPRA